MEKPSNLRRIDISDGYSFGIGEFLNHGSAIYQDTETGEMYASFIVGPVAGHYPLKVEYGGQEAFTRKIAEVLQQQYFGVTAEEGYEFKGIFPFEPSETESSFWEKSFIN